MAAVSALGYVVVSATDLDAWEAFAVDLLGLQSVARSDGRLLLRMDDRAFRVDLRRGPAEGVRVLGWEVDGRVALEEVASSLRSAGFDVRSCPEEDAEERMVTGLIRFVDPEGTSVEVFYGAKHDSTPFSSPTGARFRTGSLGLGHVFQLVRAGTEYRRLYEDVLGFRLSDHIDFARGITGTFLRCNPRHHSFAYASFPSAPLGVGHLMIEVEDIDTLGRAWDRVQAGAAPVALSLGRHTNDEMLSFYAVSPSGFQVEYGYGGLEVDEARFRPRRWDAPSRWGHVRSARVREAAS